MIPANLRRIIALTALMFSLSLLPAQAAGGRAGAPRGISLAERVEHWELLAWNFLAGLFEKRSADINPDGARATTTDCGHGDH